MRLKNFVKIQNHTEIKIAIFVPVMKFTMSKRILTTVFLAIIFISCAKRGSITGGEKDIYPPKVLQTSPANFSTHFDKKELIIQFDEYVKLKDVNKQLIVSPPLKHRLDITPYNATKQIYIRFRDTLLPNTTYSLNFGQSIEDNNEGNKLQGYRYVFSTGSYIDSLSISGYIKDALDKDTESFVSVMLYDVNQEFNDSLVYKNNPRYITNTLDSLTTFTLENLKEGEYLLVALKDKNNNNRFDPKQDKIAFNSTLISIPTDENFKLELFKEIPTFRPVRAFEASKNKLIFAYEGQAEQTEIVLHNEQERLETITTKVQGKDSLAVWYKPVEADSLNLKVYNDTITRDFIVKLKEKKLDTLLLSMKASKRLNFRDNLNYTSTTPLVAFDKTKFELITKDSLAVDLDYKYDTWTQNLELIFDKEEKQKYFLTLYPGAVTDFFGKVNDTIKTDLSTAEYSNYGNLKITLQNVKEFPVIVQLTDDKGKVVVEYYSSEENVVEFLYLDPALYNMRIIYDANQNKIWDTGNYLQKIQPEKVICFPEKIDIRANWDVEQIFILRE